MIAVGHHLGTLSAPFGDVGAIQWADLVDLLGLYLVVGALLMGGRSALRPVAALAALLSLAAAGVVAAL